VELSEYVLEPLREDEEFILSQGRPRRAEAPSVLLLAPASTRPAPESLKKLELEFSLRDELNLAWAIRPIAFTQQQNRTMLVCEDPGGQPLDRLLLRQPMELKEFLRRAIGLAARLPIQESAMVSRTTFSIPFKRMVSSSFSGAAPERVGVAVVAINRDAF
jgi:hypothetical protein